MANFSFLADKPEYRSFSKDCIEAEEAFQNSFDSCVKLVRTALDAAVKWIYSTDKNFAAQRKKFPVDKKDNLYDLIANAPFERAIGKTLAGELHYCRKAGNAAIHNEKEFSAQEAVTCLKNLFDFVQWLDKHYGKNFKPRAFNPEDVPAKDSTLKKVLKGAGLVAVGVIGTIAALMFTDDKNKS